MLLTAIGVVLIAPAVAGSSEALATVLGGLGLNAVIGGLFFVLRPLPHRLRAFLTPWLPW